MTTPPTPASEAGPAHSASYGTQEATYDDVTSSYTGYDTGTYATGGYDTGAWQTATGSHQNLNYDPYAAQHHAAYDTGAYDTTGWQADYQQLSAIPAQAPAQDDGTGQWDARTWLPPEQTGGTADQTQQWEWGTQSFDTGAYDATEWNSASTPDVHETSGDGYDAADAVYDSPDLPFDQQPTTTFEATLHAETETGELPVLLDGQEETAPYDADHQSTDHHTPTPRPGGRAATRAARRKPPAKRSALLTIAVPSACVMSVAGIAAASVGTFSDDAKETTASSVETKSVKPSAANNKLDTQLASLSAEADAFADRASRTQERIDLKAQQETERKKAAAEAARLERLRPKYALPVAQHGLSAYYGQSGINWMSMHTGIDFPVAYGTTVMAVTDGTVRTQWNSAYGNMLILTAKDGTETWYCHLSSYRVASGTTVKAGDPIAYSGNSGNSTGPHLHLEVRPNGGSSIDPLPWLRSHGLDPT
ncbi:M23 family metallopeptidase [Streptomyces acidiscabies]|uniref:Peptidase M23 n=1 Tax=Streptomyces acidiscabies TaxID=42234 RepID=A0A0L0JZD4_9ACTN|nr:M23 family metallopeptidase [Streptomyces acidiscabies]KND30941.1 peptidase M23 [Streptomyces acidiscabies]